MKSAQLFCATILSASRTPTSLAFVLSSPPQQAKAGAEGPAVRFRSTTTTTTSPPSATALGTSKATLPIPFPDFVEHLDLSETEDDDESSRSFFRHFPTSTMMLDDDPLIKQLRGKGFKPELTETDKEYALTFPIDLPAPEHIRVEVEGPVLTLSLHRTKEDTGGGRAQLSAGSVMRSFILPDGLDTDEMTKTVVRGKLLLTFPKTSDFAAPPPGSTKEQQQEYPQEGRVWHWFDEEEGDALLHAYYEPEGSRPEVEERTGTIPVPSQSDLHLNMRSSPPQPQKGRRMTRVEASHRANLAVSWHANHEKQSEYYLLDVALPMGTRRGDVSLSLDTHPWEGVQAFRKVHAKDHFVLKIAVKGRGGQRYVQLPADVSTVEGDITASFIKEWKGAPHRGGENEGEGEGEGRGEAVSGLSIKLARVKPPSAFSEMKIPIA